MQVLRESLGPDIDIAVDFHAKTSPSVASVLVKEVEPLNLLFIEEPCPPENVQAMAKIARRSTTPIATGERLVAHYGCRELIEMGVIDILQTDINHVGGITGLWKVSQMAAVSGISMAPHACEGPIGGLATSHVNSAMPNFVVQEICGQIQPGPTDKVWQEWFGFPAMRMVDGRFPLARKAGLGLRAGGSESRQISVRRHPADGAGLPRGRLGRGVVSACPIAWRSWAMGVLVASRPRVRLVAAIGESEHQAIDIKVAISIYVDAMTRPVNRRSRWNRHDEGER